MTPPCPMHPVAESITLADKEFNWLPGEDLSGACADVPEGGWSEMTSGDWRLAVHVDGPEGSGRFWKVVIAVSPLQQSTPERGACLTTSSIGWRTLQRYSGGPLPWLEDVDEDGRAELILWDSFPLREEASMAEFALVAWVYRLASPHSLVVDHVLSRSLARSLANEYRSGSNASNRYKGDLRAEAALALETFAGRGCGITDKQAGGQ